jgi:pimeloyl-ACP methyl ester carboxylesterase
MPEQFCPVGPIELCYETFGQESDPTVLLIMGLGMQMIVWHEDFCRELAAHGLYVVRFDNRDIGHSTHLDGVSPPSLMAVLRGNPQAPYTLTDMAGDAAGLLTQLELAPAHVIGASMGGMIAQMLAARHPELVSSLTSIMSNTGSLWSGQPTPALYPLLLRRSERNRERAIEQGVRMVTAIGSTGLPQDTEDVRALAAQSYDRDHDRSGVARQLGAIVASGDRTAQLRRVLAPTLVVHGSADRLVRPSGARATARAISGARLMMIQGMGHDLPRAAWPKLIDAILANLVRSARIAQPA